MNYLQNEWVNDCPPERTAHEASVQVKHAMEECKPLTPAQLAALSRAVNILRGLSDEL